jgi:Na+-translocating ferredoxin:NAD+ oxidoreductase RnfC subunit
MEADGHHICVNIPLHQLAPSLTSPQLRKVAKLHGVTVKNRNNSAELIQALIDHQCGSCAATVSVFNVEYNVAESIKIQQIKKKSAQKQQQREKKKEAATEAFKVKKKISEALRKKQEKARHKKLQNTVEVNEDKPIFPPRPPSLELKHQVISGMCEELNAANFEEAGCSICGSLTPLFELPKNSALNVNWDLLCKRRGH